MIDWLFRSNLKSKRKISKKSMSEIDVHLVKREIEKSTNGPLEILKTYIPGQNFASY